MGGTIEAFHTFGRAFSQPLLANVVRQYLAIHESEICWTTGFDPLSANVLCDFNFVSRRKKRQDNYSLLNFLPKGSDIFAVCSSSGGQELEVIQKKSGEKRARIMKRIAQVRSVQVTVDD